MAGADHVGELWLPLISWKVLGVCVPTPESLKDHLIFCLITGRARLNNRRCCHGTVILTDMVSECPIVHEPEVIPLDHHRLKHDAPRANWRSGPQHAHLLVLPHPLQCDCVDLARSVEPRRSSDDNREPMITSCLGSTLSWRDLVALGAAGDGVVDEEQVDQDRDHPDSLPSDFCVQRHTASKRLLARLFLLLRLLRAQVVSDSPC